MSSSFCTSVTIRVCVLIWGHGKSRSSGTAAKGPTCAVAAAHGFAESDKTE